MPLNVTCVPIDSTCEGERWDVRDEKFLAQIIALVAMGQAIHAKKILKALAVAAPRIRSTELYSGARKTLSITGATNDNRKASRWHRDGFIFEIISWSSAHKPATASSLIKSPHVKSTTQGLDGLMLDIDLSNNTIKRATICEDKCSENPRDMFRDEVIPAFSKFHLGERSVELIDAAAALLATSFSDDDVITASADVLDIHKRRYRAALVVEKEHDSQKKRGKLFKNFDNLQGILQTQRLGATFIVHGTLRNYFDKLAAGALAVLDRWEQEAQDV